MEREEAERARREKARQEAKRDILAAVASWDETTRIHAYFEAAECGIRRLDEGEQQVVLGRLQAARALIGVVDPLAVLKQRKGPEER